MAEEKKLFDINAATPEAAAYRGRMADIDCDIEGMAKDPELSALTDQWIAEGVTPEEYLRRLRKAMNLQDDLTIAGRMNREERWQAIYESVVYDASADPVVLRNKENIQDFHELEKFERAAVKLRAAEGFPAAAFEQSPDGLKALHRHLFQDVYTWAGEFRGYPTSRGQHFSLPDFIPTHADTLFRQVKEEKSLKGMEPEKFADRAAHFVNGINSIHPFIDGNGRVQRAWLRNTANAADYRINFRDTDRQLWNDVSMLGHMTADNPEIGYRADDPMKTFILMRLEHRSRDISKDKPPGLQANFVTYLKAAARIRAEQAMSPEERRLYETIPQ